MTDVKTKLRYTSISARISILLGLIILITMGVFSAVSLIKQEDDSIDSMSRSALLLSQTTEKILRFSMLKNRRDEISKAISDIVGESGIKSVRILNHNGVIKFSSQEAEVGKHISRADQLCANCHERNGASQYPVDSFYRYHLDKKTDIVYTSLPIYNSPSCYNGDCHEGAEKTVSGNLAGSATGAMTRSVHDSSQTILGFIEIDISAQKIISNLGRSRAELIALTILIALAASMITFFSIRYLVGKPVKKLVDGTRRVAEGDFSQDIPPGRAEIGVLAESFNHMQRQLLSTQSQLIESEKLASVGELTSEIANEISNPLTGIIIYAESLLGRSTSEGKEKRDYETILQEALKIRESLRNVLSLTKREKPHFTNVDVAGIVKHAVSVLEKFSNFRNIRIITGIQKGLPKVSADAALLEQVFLDLLLLSSEDMPEGGILNISAAYVEKEKEIEIRFTDSGKGVPENVLRVFSDQDDSSVPEHVERTRVSLAVCKDIIKLHKGRIRAHSRAGDGTSITIELPV